MTWHEDRERILHSRINELGLRVEGSELEPLIKQLYRELDQSGVAFKPPIYLSDEWHRIFGPYSRPYLESYKPNPFSRDYVRNVSGWYAQKHPDEDFAETF